MAFADLTARLQLNTQDFSAKLTSAAVQMKRFSSQLSSGYDEANEALKRHTFGLKDTTRIVQGILVSQAFYGMARSINDATSALLNFNEKLDYAHVTYSALFGDPKLATDFSKMLQEMAVNSVFDYETLADASKKLVAYGIEYEKLGHIMGGLIDLTTISGDAAAMDRIAYAIGQIYAKGTLKAEEMRQLANAYVPIQKILQEKLGLSGEDLGNVGNLQIPAEVAIDAIVEYANERFGSASEAAMYTITGLKNRIIDTLKVVGAEVLGPITLAWKSFLKYVADGLQVLRDKFNRGGIGGIFEYLVPSKAAQTTIRAFLANVHNLIKALISILSALMSHIGLVAQTFMTAFNIIGPAVTGVLNIFALFLQSLADNAAAAAVLRTALFTAAAAFIVLKIHAAGALIITALTNAITGLAKALLVLSAIIVKHPILALLAALVIALTGVAVASNNAGNSLAGLFKTISGLGGTTSQDDILKNIKDDLDDGSDSSDGLKDSLEDGSDAAGDLEKGINKAAKAARGLLSFDEVFKLPDNKASEAGSGVGTGALGDIEGLISGLDALGDALIPEIPDFTDFIKGFTDELFGGLKDSFIGQLAIAGLGGLLVKNLFDNLLKALKGKEGMAGMIRIIGAIGKLLLGAFIGLGFDAIASLFTDKLWQALEDALHLSSRSSDNASFASTVASVIGGAIGMLVGGLPGSVIGAAIGHLAGGIAGLVWDEIGGALSNTVVGGAAGISAALSGALLHVFRMVSYSGSSWSSLFSGIANAIKTTGIKAIAKGGIIGMAIGYVVDGIAALLWNGLDEKFANANKETAKIGQTIGSILGTIIGALIGGPAGAMIGSAIGTFVGGFVGLFWEPIKEYFDPANNVLSAFFVNTALELGAWANDTITGLTTWWSDTKALFDNWWTSTVDGFKAWIDDTFGRLLDWWTNTVATFSDWSSINGETLTNWWTDTKEGFSGWVSDTFENLLGWFTNTFNTFTTWTADTLAAFVGWVSETSQKFDTWRAELIDIIVNWAADALSTIKTWITETVKNIIDWSSNVHQKFTAWRISVMQVIIGFFIAAKEAFVSKLRELVDTTVEKLEAVKTTWRTKFEDVKTRLYDWFVGLKTSMGEWLDKYIWKPISDFFDLSNFWNKIKGLLDAIKDKIAEWWKGLADVFSEDIEVDANATVKSTVNASRYNLAGHAAGGIFTREHVARFAEGNKAEMAVPLENAAAMQPFVNAISNGLIEGLAPTLLQVGNNSASSLPPMYVGTLIADERGIKELYKKFEVIQIQENARRGLATK